MADNDFFKRIIAVQQREILVENERLKGVENLVRICSEKETKILGLKTTVENLETALRRADARIAYLNKKLGIGPQTTLGIDVVSPGVSRKDLDAVTRENIRLKEALEHISPTEAGGKDIVIGQTTESLVKHIHNLEREKEKSKKALEAYKNKKPRKKLDIGSQTNVVYPEVPRKDFDAGTGENRSFKEALGVDGPRGVEGHKDIQSLELRVWISTHHGNSIEQASATADFRDKEYRVLQEKEKLVRENESLRKQVIELNTEVMKGNENRGKMEAELSEYQEKCDGFYNQVVMLNAKLLESEKKADNLAVQVVRKEDMIARMRDQIDQMQDENKCMRLPIQEQEKQ